MNVILVIGAAVWLGAFIDLGRIGALGEGPSFRNQWPHRRQQVHAVITFLVFLVGMGLTITGLTQVAS